MPVENVAMTIATIAIRNPLTVVQPPPPLFLFWGLHFAIPGSLQIALQQRNTR
nr:hypothetical protein Iba_chr12dCG3310 [Ipomoea batatas]